jgi:hypothetical protein
MNDAPDSAVGRMIPPVVALRRARRHESDSSSAPAAQSGAGGATGTLGGLAGVSVGVLDFGPIQAVVGPGDRVVDWFEVREHGGVG